MIVIAPRDLQSSEVPQADASFDAPAADTGWRSVFINRASLPFS